MSKLTLSVDGRIVSRAKRYAKQHHISVSEMVETYLAAVSAQTAQPVQDTPNLRALRGVLKKADKRDFRKHLAAKYR